MKKLFILLLLVGAVLGWLWIKGYMMAGEDLKSGGGTTNVSELNPVSRHGYDSRMKSNSHYRRLENDVGNAVSK